MSAFANANEFSSTETYQQFVQLISPLGKDELLQLQEVLNQRIREVSTKAPSSSDASTFDLHEYEILNELGEGGFAVVKLVKHKVTGKLAALKVIDKTKLGPEDLQNLQKEVRIMFKVRDSPNVVHCYGFQETESEFYLLLELLAGGELFDRIVTKSRYDEKDARDVVRIMIQSIQYCHRQGVVHRDLKPENLLLESKDNDALVKLADFGLSTEDTSGSIEDRVGTPNYIAPEILDFDHPYGREVDMWALGVIAYIVIGGYPPFDENSDAALYKKIKKGQFTFHAKYWDHVSPEAKDLISRLICVDVSHRLTADQALAHPWFGTADALLQEHDMGANLEQFKKFNATRKLRGTTRAIMAANKMASLFKKKDSSTTTASSTTSLSSEVASEEDGTEASSPSSPSPAIKQSPGAAGFFNNILKAAGF